jgi:hypothetical protein
MVPCTSGQALKLCEEKEFHCLQAHGWANNSNAYSMSQFKAWGVTAPDKAVVHYHQSQPLTVIHQKVSLLCTFTASWLVIMFQAVTLSISWPGNSSFKTSRPNNLYWLVNCKEYQDLPRLCELLHHNSCFSHQLGERNGFLHSASPQIKTWRPYILIRSWSRIPDTWPTDKYPTVL